MCDNLKETQPYKGLGNYDTAKQQMGQAANQAIRPMNEIERMEKELAAQRQLIHDQEQELLQLYRRIHAHDKPERGW